MAELQSSEVRSEGGPTTGLRQLTGTALVVAIAGMVGICFVMMVLPALFAGAAIGAGLSLLTGSALWLVGAVVIAVIAYLAYHYGQRRA